MSVIKYLKEIIEYPKRSRKLLSGNRLPSLYRSSLSNLQIAALSEFKIHTKHRTTKDLKHSKSWNSFKYDHNQNKTVGLVGSSSSVYVYRKNT